MKRYHSAIALGIILAVLGGVAYWDDVQTKKDEASDKNKNKLLNISSEQVEKVLYENGSGATELKVELEKNSGVWNLSAPVRAKAEQNVVTSLLQTLTDYKFEKQVGDHSEAWAKFGLDKPERKITLMLAGGKSVTVFIGSKSPVGYSVYARTSESDKSYIGAQHLFTATEKKLNDFRDRTFFDVKDDQLVRVEIKNSKNLITLIRSSPKEPFTLKIKETVLPTDVDAVADFLSNIRAEKTEDFVDQPTGSLLSSFSSQKNLGSISFELIDGTKKVLLLAEHDKKAYVSFDPSILAYRISDSFKDKLVKKDAMSFRDKAVAKFSAGDVIEATLDDITYIKIAGEWKKKGEEKPESPAFTNIQNLIVDLEYARAEQIFDAGDQKMKDVLKTTPVHKITLKFKPDNSGRGDLVLSAWQAPKTSSSKDEHAKGDGEKIYIFPAGAKFVFETKKSVLDNVAIKTSSQDTSVIPSQSAAPAAEMPSIPEDTD